jgi:hypothetical protein
MSARVIGRCWRRDRHKRDRPADRGVQADGDLVEEAVRSRGDRRACGPPRPGKPPSRLARGLRFEALRPVIDNVDYVLAEAVSKAGFVEIGSHD